MENPNQELAPKPSIKVSPDGFAFNESGQVTGYLPSIDVEPTARFFGFAMRMIGEYDQESQALAMALAVNETKREEMVMEHMAKLESDPVYAALQAQIDEATALRSRAAAKASYLRKIYGETLARYAETQFKGGSRTFQSVFGTVSLTRNPPLLAVRDEAKVIAWCERQNFIEAVRKTFLISKLGKDIAASLMNPEDYSAERLDGIGMAIKPATDTISITTGVSGSTRGAA